MSTNKEVKLKYLININVLKIGQKFKNTKQQNIIKRNTDDIRYLKIKHKYYDDVVELLKNKGWL